MKNCSVCLVKCISLISVQKSDKNNVNWLTKLQDVIPELEWLEQYMICENCSKQLEKAWEFKKFVLNREKDRRTVEGKEVTCEVCLKIFTTITQLQQHKLQLHNEQVSREEMKSQNVFTCYNCNEIFNVKEKLISHIENEHREAKLYSYNTVFQNPIDEDSFHNIEDCSAWEKLSNDEVSQFYCNVCSKSFATEEIFQSHFKICINSVDGKLMDSYANKRNLHDFCKEEVGQEIVEESAANFCQQCRINFRSVEEFELHNSTKHSAAKKRRGRKPLRKFYCEICNEEFGYVKLVVEHCVSVHTLEPKTVKAYSCDKCDMRFVSSANLDQHRNYHDKNRTHICSLCGKGFITKSDLTVHEYTHYNRRNYKCTMCDKAFNTNKNLRTHNLVVHTDRSLWKYACSFCEKRFPLKTNYDQHLRRHTGEKEHACHICKKLFISKSELQRHVHMHSNIRAFKCANCDKEYKERRTYQAHLAKKHGIGNVKITVREKKFVCHICPSQFYDKQKLMRHICSHSGLKPFACYACDKKFTDKSYLKHHLKTAHNITEQCKIGEIQ